MAAKSLHQCLAINDVWLHEVSLPGRNSTRRAWSFGQPSVVETSDGWSVELAATTVALMLFDGRLPRDQPFTLRAGYRVLGSFLLVGIEHTARAETLQLVMKLVERAGESQQPPGPLDLAVMSAHSWGALCIDRATGETLRVSCSAARDLVPGDCMRFYVRKTWKRGRTTFVSGEYDEPVVDVAAFGVPPLLVTQAGDWDPCEQAWEPEGWASITQLGRRARFRMQVVLPRVRAGEAPDADPISAASRALQSGEAKRAQEILLSLVEKDLRCLDAHAQLGNLSFDKKPKKALRHYAVGVELGEHALGADFSGVLLWNDTENRPFLRCLYGYGLCMWRLDRRRDALQILDRMLWLNPPDEQGARYLRDAVTRGHYWSPAVSPGSAALLAMSGSAESCETVRSDLASDASQPPRK